MLVVLATFASVAIGAASANHIATLTGFNLPETVEYDPAQDVYFVSNMAGVVTAKDNNGFISKIDARQPDRHTPFIAGGRDGVELHGPKGMTCIGTVLWVADIDALRAFDARSGRPLRVIGIPSAKSLNDVTHDSAGNLYVTDPRLIFTAASSTHVGFDRIYFVSSEAQGSVLLLGDDMLRYPNGIEWDTRGQRLVIAPLGPAAPVLAWRFGETAPATIASGPGGYDGLEIDASGRMLVSSLVKEAILEIVAGQMLPLIENLAAPGNFAWDFGRNRLVVPLIESGKVEIWELPQRER
jgi:sugar lactone lactonase YvrE